MFSISVTLGFKPGNLSWPKQITHLLSYCRYACQAFLFLNSLYVMGNDQQGQIYQSVGDITKHVQKSVKKKAVLWYLLYVCLIRVVSLLTVLCKGCFIFFAYSMLHVAYHAISCLFLISFISFVNSHPCLHLSLTTNSKMNLGQESFYNLDMMPFLLKTPEKPLGIKDI